MVEGRNRAAIDESTDGQPREGMGDTKTPLHWRRWWLTGKVSSQGIGFAKLPETPAGRWC
jgi:hypothetical protein